MDCLLAHPKVRSVGLHTVGWWQAVGLLAGGASQIISPRLLLPQLMIRSRRGVVWDGTRLAWQIPPQKEDLHAGSAQEG